MDVKKEPPPQLAACHTCKADMSMAYWSSTKECWTVICRGSKPHKHDFWKGTWIREDKRQRQQKKELKEMAAASAEASAAAPSAAAPAEVKKETGKPANVAKKPKSPSTSSSSSSSSSSDSESSCSVKEVNLPTAKKPRLAAAEGKQKGDAQKGDAQKAVHEQPQKEKADALHERNCTNNFFLILGAGSMPRTL